jgi:hypothetical protein
MLEAVRRWPTGYAPIVALVQALAALEQGALEQALGSIARAEVAPGHDEALRASVLGARALIRALAGEVTGARTDAAAVQRIAAAPLPALGRATLAEAIALVRAGDHAGIAELFARPDASSTRALWAALPLSREAALGLGYSRLARAGHARVYRQLAAVRAEGPFPVRVVQRWLARVAPEVAALVEPAAIAARLHANQHEHQASGLEEEEAPPGTVAVSVLDYLAARPFLGVCVFLLLFWAVVTFVYATSAGERMGELLGASLRGVLILAGITALMVRGALRRLGARRGPEAGPSAQIEALVLAWTPTRSLRQRVATEPPVAPERDEDRIGVEAEAEARAVAEAAARQARLSQ